MDTPQHKNPLPLGVMEFTILEDPSLVIITTCLSLVSLFCVWVWRRVYKEITHFNYMSYMATPLHKNPCPGGHEIYNLVTSFVGHYY